MFCLIVLLDIYLCRGCRDPKLSYVLNTKELIGDSYIHVQVYCRYYRNMNFLYARMQETLQQWSIHTTRVNCS